MEIISYWGVIFPEGSELFPEIGPAWCIAHSPEETSEEKNDEEKTCREGQSKTAEDEKSHQRQLR